MMHLNAGACLHREKSFGPFVERHKDGSSSTAQAGECSGGGHHHCGVSSGDGFGHHQGHLRGHVSALAGGLHVPEHVQDCF